MPTHGPPGDPHNRQAAQTFDPFATILEMIMPAIGTALYNVGEGGQAIRDYYDPVLGLADPRQRRQLASNLQTTGERAFKGYREDVKRTFDTAQGAVSYLIPDELRPRFNTPEFAAANRPTSARQAILGQRGDLNVQRGIDRFQRGGQGIASAFGNIPVEMGNILQSLFGQGPGVRAGPTRARAKLRGKTRLPLPQTPFQVFSQTP